jgi:rifampicin phosphotransferase
METVVIGSRDPGSSDSSEAGGKGANLGKLTGAGFPVPPWFCVSTAAHRRFLAQPAVGTRITEQVAQIDFSDPDDVEIRTAEIRVLVESAPFPDGLAELIWSAYQELGADEFVAVRSSAVAEDLADASFAGMHDTYLDVRGREVIDAVRRCWASVWSSRAATYRHNKGFPQTDAVMGVVVQRMIPADTAGVMFTANPLTSATDETVINASYGLGEAIVAGLAVPDQYVVKSETLRIKTSELGSKLRQVVRDPDAPCGTRTVAVPDAQRDVAALTDAAIVELADLGRRVQSHYEGIPQDIEWAFAGSSLHLLQSRPITGIDFSWDTEIDGWQPVPEDDDSTWTRALADEVWTGAITPLMYSWRAQQWNWVPWHIVDLIDRKDLRKVRTMKYHRGQAYWNCEYDQAFIDAAPPIARQSVAQRLPADWREAAVARPWRVLDYLKVLVRTMAITPKLGPYGWFKAMDDHFTHRVDDCVGLPDSEVRLLSDTALRKHIDDLAEYEYEYNIDISWPGLFMYCRDVMSLLHFIVTEWYDGPNEFVFGDLLAGYPEMTATLLEHVELARIAGEVRKSPSLTEVFTANPGEAFFEALESAPDGGEVLAACRAFLAAHGHRGHADRDIYFPRYGDDVGLLYRVLEIHLKSEDDAHAQFAENNRRREKTTADVLANLQRKPLGWLKAQAFQLALDYSLRFLVLRDNERHHIDRNTYSTRKAFLEVNRRLLQRGLVDTDRDLWFLTQDELFELLHGRANRTLTRAKIRGRMRNFDQVNSKELTNPKFLRGRVPILEESAVTTLDDGSRLLQGFPASRGAITGVARIVKEHSQMGTVQKGEIAVVNSTDPGWTPMFAVIGGIVAETGGLLSHFACLAREYGFPAVQIENALRLIPDGATIAVDGDTGRVVVTADN